MVPSAVGGQGAGEGDGVLECEREAPGQSAIGIAGDVEWGVVEFASVGEIDGDGGAFDAEAGQVGRWGGAVGPFGIGGLGDNLGGFEEVPLLGVVGLEGDEGIDEAHFAEPERAGERQDDERVVADADAGNGDEGIFFEWQADLEVTQDGASGPGHLDRRGVHAKTSLLAEDVEEDPAGQVAFQDEVRGDERGDQQDHQRDGDSDDPAFHGYSAVGSVVGMLPTVRGPKPKTHQSSRVVRPMNGPEEATTSPVSDQ